MTLFVSLRNAEDAVAVLRDLQNDRRGALRGTPLKDAVNLFIQAYVTLGDTDKARGQVLRQIRPSNTEVSQADDGTVVVGGIVLPRGDE